MAEERPPFPLVFNIISFPCRLTPVPINPGCEGIIKPSPSHFPKKAKHGALCPTRGFERGAFVTPRRSEEFEENIVDKIPEGLDAYGRRQPRGVNSLLGLHDAAEVSEYSSVYYGDVLFLKRPGQNDDSGTTQSQPK